MSLLFAAIVTPPVHADIIRTATSVIFTGSGSYTSGTITGIPLSLQASLWTDPGQPGTLNLLLQNTSPVATIDPAGLLTSFYFGVRSGTAAPALTYLSGTGQVYQIPKDRNDPDIPGLWTPPAIAGGDGTFTPTLVPGQLSNLMALKDKDETWEFRRNLSLPVAGFPSLNYGIGTTGNNSLSPNNFDGNIVGDIQFGIYTGDASTSNFQNDLLVRNSALFQFSGFDTGNNGNGFTIGDVDNYAVFGLGSAPDQIVTVPEPQSLALVATGGLAALGLRRRRNARFRTKLRVTAAAA